MTLRISVKHNFGKVQREIEEIIPRLDEAMRSATYENTDALHDDAVDKINKRNPSITKTYEKIEKDVVPTGHGAIGYVGTDDKVAQILEEGSPPHEIEGHPLLRFEWGGRMISVRKVDHPGTKPYEWLLRAAESQEPAMRERYVAAVAEVLGG